MRMGFELEMMSPLNRPAFIEKLHADLGILAVEPQRFSQRDYTKWQVVNDGSIRSLSANRDLRQPAYGHELISPPLPFEEAMEKLRLCFNWMTDNNVETNDTTGLHIGLSFDDLSKNAQLDGAKLAFLLDENKILKLFGRGRNRYCHGVVPAIRKKIKSQMEHSARIGGVPDVPLNSGELKKFLPTDKYYFVNFTKLASQGYLEFRGMGGLNYHKRFDDVRSSINHFADCMDQAADPSKTSKRLEGKISTVLKKGKEKALEITASNLNRLEAERLRTMQSYETRIAALRQVQDRINGG